jgi:hypothetical protein
VAQALELLGRKRALHVHRLSAVAYAHQVFFFNIRVFANELARHAAVLGQHQQADRVDIQAAGRCQTAQLFMPPAHAAVAFTPAVLRLHQHHRRLVPVFGLAADVTDRFVNQDSDLLALLMLGLLRHLDAVRRRYGLTHLSRLAVDAHPAPLNPVIGLTARAHAQLGHALVQPHGAASGGRRAGSVSTANANSSWSRRRFGRHRRLGHGVVKVGRRWVK